MSPDKEFATLAAAYAIAGYALILGDPGDAPAAYYATRWGWIKPMASLDVARAFLRQIGGVK